MQKTIVFTALLLLASLCTQAQSEKTIKLYLNSNFSSTSTSQNSNGFIVNTESISGNLLGFSPAITSTKESGRYTEFEFSNFRIGMGEFSQTAFSDSTRPPEYLAGSQYFSFYTAVRYEYGFNIKALLGKPQEGVSYALGLAVQPFVGSSLSKPFVSNEFRRGNFNVGARFQLVPRIMFGGKGNWFIDFNFPINLIDVDVTRIRTDNPSLPLELQRFTQGSIDFFPFELQARVGIGIRI